MIMLIPMYVAKKDPTNVLQGLFVFLVGCLNKLPTCELLVFDHIPNQKGHKNGAGNQT